MSCVVWGLGFFGGFLVSDCFFFNLACTLSPVLEQKEKEKKVGESGFL